jgi:hypothetical protein
LENTALESLTRDAKTRREEVMGSAGWEVGVPWSELSIDGAKLIIFEIEERNVGNS